jgi:hypothetical protein
VSYLSNDAGYITSADIPASVSYFINDTNYITSSDAKMQIEDYHYITSSDIPKNISYFDNDIGYIVLSDIPIKISEYVNDVGYITGISSLTFTKNGEMLSVFNGKSDVSVDLASELSAGYGISIDDNKINCNLSVASAGDAHVTLDDCTYTVSVSIPKNVSEFENDALYTPRPMLSTLLSDIVLSADTYNELLVVLGRIIEVFGGKLCIDFDED